LTRNYTITGLTPGVAYSFYVRVRNAVGFSSNSSMITIVCSQPPSQPAVPTVTVNQTYIVVNWTAPYNGGSSITNYTIQIRTGDGVTF